MIHSTSNSPFSCGNPLLPALNLRRWIVALRSRKGPKPHPRRALHPHPVALALALLFLATAVAPVRATPVVDNNAGRFTDEYNDYLGIYTNSGVLVSGSTVSLIPGNTTGYYSTAQIIPTSFDRWLRLTFDNASYGADNDLTAEVRSLDDTVVLISAQPVAGGIDLSALNPPNSQPLVPGIRVRVHFNKREGGAPPIVAKLEVTWNPVSQLLLDMKGPAKVEAGQGIVCSVRYSANYVEAKRLVVWASLPNYERGSLVYPPETSPTPYAVQNDDPGPVTAINKGGFYTATAITVDGAMVPSNSVCWVLGNVPEGTTDLLSYTLATRNGTLDQTTVTNRAYASATNATNVVVSQLVGTAIRSKPAPFLDILEGAAIFNIGGKLQTRANTINTFNIIARNNFQSVGREAMYYTVLYDDVRGLTNVINRQLGVNGFFNISPAGAFIADYNPDGSGPFPAIVWTNVGTLVGAFGPGASFSGSFSVQLLDDNDLPNTNYTNRACLTSDQTKDNLVCDHSEVQIGLDDKPYGSFAKGDNASGFFNISAATDDNPAYAVPYGESVGFGLMVINNSAVKLNELVFRDMMPTNTTFRRAWFNEPNLINSGAKIFYSTSNIVPISWTNPPRVDYTKAPDDLDESPNNYWERYDVNPPANPSNVTWVAFYIPQVDSIHLPTNLPTAGSNGPITSAVGYFEVKVSTNVDQCTDTLLLNLGQFQVFEWTDLDGMTNPITGDPRITNDVEQVVAQGYKGQLLVVGQSAITPLPVQLPTTNAAYTLTVGNQSSATSDALNDVQAVIQLSKVNVNGREEYPSVLELFVQDIRRPISYNTETGQLTIELGQLNPGDARSIRVRLGLPDGILNQTEYFATATITGHDKCGPSTATDLARGQVLSSPKLRVFTRPVVDLIRSGDEYECVHNYVNIGTGPSTKTFVIAFVPERTTLVRAYGNEHMTSVWFSRSLLLPPALTPFAPITGGMIYGLGFGFERGTRSLTDDSWISPFPEGEAYCVAWEVDDPALIPPQLPLTTNRTVRFVVRNDDNGQAAGTEGSPEGTQLFNEAGIFSSELLQAIGNQVITTIKDQPSILVRKDGPNSVEAGLPFDWVVTYYNNSSTPDDTVVMKDRLPPGITFVSATHQWNATAAAANAPGGNTIQPVFPIVDIQGGFITLTFNIAGTNGYRGTNVPLASLEGGTLTLRVQSDTNTACGTFDVNEACATATTATNTFQDCASHQVTIFCPDLELQKYVSPEKVLAGEFLTYTLEVANRGRVAAHNVALIDTLPAGVSYVPNSRTVSAGYLLEEPTITGTPLTGQTLTWTNGNALTRIGGLVGDVPGDSGKITIRFTVKVADSVAPCTTLTNMARVLTTSVDPGAYPNEANASVTVPAPELAVSNFTPAATALPGNQVTWTLSWENRSIQPATDVYLVESLPNNVTFISVAPPDGVTRYYHGPANSVPVFDPANPLEVANGWSLTPTVRVSYVALLVGTLTNSSRPFTAQVTVELKDTNGIPPLAGTCFTNTVVLRHQHVPPCDTNDIAASSVVCTPALDLAVTKTGSVQGAFPGIAPGEAIIYTLTFENTGTETAYGVRVTDTLPATLLPGNPFDDFNVVTLVGGGGSPVDRAGNPIIEAVPVTRVTNGTTVTWYLGTTNSGSLNYTNVGLPSGSRGSFPVYVTVAEWVADNTVVCNPAAITNDVQGVRTEDLLANNTSQTCVTVRRPDVAVRKTGVEEGTGARDFVEVGKRIVYTVEFNNLGNIAAQNARIEEFVPSGTCLDSVNAPPGATVTYSTNQGRVTSFSVDLGALPAPANSVGAPRSFNDSPPSGEGLPSLSITYLKVPNAVEVTWGAGFVGFCLQVTGELKSNPSETVWTDVSERPVTFPDGRQGVTLLNHPNLMPNCFFRLKSGGTCCQPEVSYAVAKPDGFLAWKTLFVDATIPPGTDIRYSVGRVRGTSIDYDLGPTYTSVSVGPDGLDLSGINPTNTTLVLRAVTSPPNATNAPCLNSWMMTYYSAHWPSFTFTVRVNDCGTNSCGDLPINNTVTISTTTPEISLANNSASYHMDTRLTDVQVQCDVSAAAALPGDTLTNTLVWQVNGPQTATSAYLLLVLPDGDGNGMADVTLNTVTPGTNVTAYYHTTATTNTPVFNPANALANGWTTNRLGANHVAFLRDTGPNGTNTITYTATVSMGTDNRTLCSSVTAYTDRQETTCTNNSCSSCTFIGTLPNVSVLKTGPDTCVHPGDLVTFTITYGNIGNTSAVNVVVTDAPPAGLTFISALPPANGPGLTWNLGTLAAGQTGMIILTNRVDNNYALVGKLTNVATIATSSEEVNVADNQSQAVLCITPDLVRLSGYVYHDRNNGCVRDPDEAGIADVTITLTGTDVFSNSVALTNITSSDGQYSFVGLNPGTYLLRETQPATWISTGDALGTVADSPPRGINTNLLDDVLGPITLFGGEAGVKYNFCENRLIFFTCATNKTECGSMWSFDNPTALSDCCSNNVTIAVLGTTTNNAGPCSQVITRTWLATDCCGTSATCSQSVTVADTTPLAITTQPADTTVTECSNVTFCVVAIGCAPLTYAWYADGVPIPNANAPCYTTPPVRSSDSGTRFTVKITNSCGTVTSREALLTVVADLEPPMLVSAVPDCASNKVTVTFSEPVTGAPGGGALDPVNYSINGGSVNIVNAMFGQGTQVVCLFIDPSTPLLSGVPYTLAVVGVNDLCGNVIIDSQIAFMCPTNPCPPQISCGPLLIQRDGVGNVLLTWGGSCQLQATASLNSPAWSSIAGSSPLLAPINSAKQFFRTVAADGSCSPNIVGYVNFTLTDGQRYLLANPLNGTNNHLDTILPLPASANGTIIERFDPTTQNTFDPITWLSPGWSTPSGSLLMDPGEGFFITMEGTRTVTFVGEVPQGNLVNPLPAGQSFQSSIAPVDGRAGAVPFLGVPGDDGDVIFVFDPVTQDFKDPYIYDALSMGWTSPSDPAPEGPFIPVGTGFVFQNVGPAKNWNQTLRLSDCAPLPPISCLTCSSNKTVECGSAWTFNPPDATACCGTNITITVVSTVTNGTCPRVITRTWQAIDCCGNTNPCSQTVTVVDTTPPAITCATNKTVECGNPWSFDPPTASDTCCGTNVTISILDTATNGLCPAIITRRWQVTDCCSHNATCSQTVTVQDTRAPVLTGCQAISTNSLTSTNGNFVSYPSPSAMDNCDGPVAVNCAPTSGSFFHTGQTTVTCRAQDLCGNSNTCQFTVTVTAQPPPHDGLCSFTQGFYGNRNGKFNGTNSLTLVSNQLAQGALVVGIPGSRSLTIPTTSALLLQQRLPGNGTPATLPIGNLTLSTTVPTPTSKGKFDNVLLGQTVTLTLNGRLSPQLLTVGLTSSFCSQGVLPGPDGRRGNADDELVSGDIQMFTIPNSVLVALTNTSVGINSLTVQGLLDLANRGLAGLLPSGPSLPDINMAVDAINRGYDECRVQVDCSTHMVISDSFNDSFATSPTLGSGGAVGGGGLAAARLAHPDAHDPAAAGQTENARAHVSNLDATKEPGEPNHAGNAGGKSVWWQWRAPRPGPVLLQTEGSSFDTLLAVYAGTALSNLVLVASNDDTAGGVLAELTFQATTNTEYRIAVDGYDAAVGAIVLTLITERPRLCLPLVRTGNQLEVCVDGQLGRTYTVEASSDLLNWTPIASLPNTDGVLRFTDPSASNASQRFYRVIEEF